MNVKVLFFAFFFALFANIANYLLYQQSVDGYTNVYGEHKIDSAWNFIDVVKNIAFPGLLVTSLQFTSLKILFLSIYYFSLAYAIVALILKALPFTGNG